MKYQILNMGSFSIGFILLFALAEYLYRFKKVEVEKTRKLVHLGSGMMTMLFPLFFQSALEVSFLSLSFLGILIASKKYKLLPSINAVERKTTGSFWFPIAVILCFLAQVYFADLAFYYLPLLTLTLADPIACLVGKSKPIHIFKLKASQKSIGGSAAFFVTALVLSMLLLDDGFLSGPITPLSIAAVATIAEFFGGKGYDNITIPSSCIATMYLLQTQILTYA